MSTDLFAFTKDLQSWKDVASCFNDIYAEANNNDIFEWHVTISKFSNGVEYKFHFIIFWHNGCPQIQPKISLLFEQRCMVESSNFFGNWVLLDKNVTLFSITSVLLGLRNVVRRINTDYINVDEFNKSNCIYCDYVTKTATNTPKEKDKPKLDEVTKPDEDISCNIGNNNLSVSNSSMVSLTISNCSNTSLDIDKPIGDINNSIIINDTDNRKKINSSLNVAETNESILKTPINSNIKIEKDTQIKEDIIPLKPKSKITTRINNNNKSKPKIQINKKISKKKENMKKPIKFEKQAVRYLEIDENGFLVWKWTEGRKPSSNQIIRLNSNKN